MSQFFSEPQDMLRQFSRRFRFPSNYVTFDIETTGFSNDDDWITEVGWAVVRNRRITDCQSLILDWTRRPEVNQQILRDKLARLIRIFEEQGRTYHVTYEKMRDEGVDPIEGLEVYVHLLEQAVRDKEFLVGHGAWRFDRRMLDSHCNEYLKSQIPWGETVLYDTGLTEKAAQLNLPPHADETLNDWFARIDRAGHRGAKWNLDGCAKKYSLTERFGADLTKAHGAAYDSQLTYALFESFTQIAEILHGEVLSR